MNDERKIGKLRFLRHNTEEKINVLWNIFQGSFEKNSWKASISFSEDFSVSEKALNLLFEAIDNNLSQLSLELEDEKKYDCTIYSITDLTDSGLIEIASPNFGRVKSIL
jgi:hypothetical protein